MSQLDKPKWLDLAKAWKITAVRATCCTASTAADPRVAMNYQCDTLLRKAN